MAGKIGVMQPQKSPETTSPGFEIQNCLSGKDQCLVVFLAAVWDAQQAEVLLAAGALQEVQAEAGFFFAKMQPLEQLLSRRLEEMRARVRSDFMVCGMYVFKNGKSLVTRAKN